MERCVLDHQLGIHRAVRKVELRHQRDDLFRAGGNADATLQAGILAEQKLRRIRIVLQRAGRAGADTGQADCAVFRVNLDPTIGRALGKRNGGRFNLLRAGKAAHREAGYAARAAKRAERCRFDLVARTAGAKPGRHQIGINLVNQDEARFVIRPDARHQRARHFNLPGDLRGLVSLVRIGKDDDLAIALGNGANQHIVPDPAGAVHGHRQHIRRQAGTEPRDHVDHARTMAGIGKKQPRCLAASFKVMVDKVGDLLAEAISGGKVRLRRP